MSAFECDPLSVVENWLALTDAERDELGLDQAFGQVRLDALGEIEAGAAQRACDLLDDGQAGLATIWADASRLASLVTTVRLTLAGFLPVELTAASALAPAVAPMIEADRQYLRAEGLLPGGMPPARFSHRDASHG